MITANWQIPIKRRHRKVPEYFSFYRIWHGLMHPDSLSFSKYTLLQCLRMFFLVSIKLLKMYTQSYSIWQTLQKLEVFWHLTFFHIRKKKDFIRKVFKISGLSVLFEWIHFLIQAPGFFSTVLSWFDWRFWVSLSLFSIFLWTLCL